MEKEEYKDMFGYYKRVKQIKPTYKLLLNNRTNYLELYDEQFCGVMLKFKLPICEDILKKVETTKVENAKNIFRKIEEENCKITQKNIENAIYFAKNQIKYYNSRG